MGSGQERQFQLIPVGFAVPVANSEEGSMELVQIRARDKRLG